MRRLSRFTFAIAAIAAVSASAAMAQSYPDRPIRLVVGYPPGGAVDIIARTIGQALTERLGHNIIVDNRPGSAANLAAEVVKNAKPDGYTLLHGPDNLFVINPHIYSRMPVDPIKDFVPVTSMIRNQLVLTVNPSKVPVNDFRGFIDFAKKAKEPLFYASIGNGSVHHLATEYLKRTAGINLIHVPYKGGGPAGIATVSGEAAVMFGGGSVVPLAKSGKLKAIAVSSTKRSKELPDLPTISEFYPDYAVTIWHGLFAPVGTPQPILDKLRTEVATVLARPDVQARLAKSGSGEPYVVPPAEFAAHIRRDYDTYGKLIKEIGLKVD
ncbi:MAG: tripartite tricarboxylate transporter substrate binding protein [Rhizobiales bacterium]|nr:tripartite tricarboxylate transporter substrate binding protein [Hyphomicrobiales bacterium]